MGKSKKDELSSSIEDYLEAIGNLEKKHRVARVKDIADNLNVQMPSVTGALKVLKGKVGQQIPYLGLFDNLRFKEGPENAFMDKLLPQF